MAGFRGRRVLVTGGAGSIGSEIVRQLLDREPAVVRVFGQDETQLYWLSEELGADRPVRFLVGDVRDRVRLVRAMRGCDTVFHAAALKHVPLCEYNPFEAVQTNVVGTQNVIDACVDAGVKRLIVISTDKAADPRHVMAATKLLAEKLVQAAAMSLKEPAAVCVRFGNVLGSRGSVVPTLMRQIELGGPVTLTDRGMTRFSMTTAEAVRLVLGAAERAFAGGETFILKMPALRVADLVEVLIEEYAPRVGKDPRKIRIRTIGMRPGERREELLLSDEECERTEDLGKYLVVHPPFRLARVAKRLAPPPAAVYRSSQAKPMGRDAIRRLLARAGVLEGGSAEERRAWK